MKDRRDINLPHEPRAGNRDPGRFDDRSIREILQDVVNHLNDLFRSEIRLAKTEVQENLIDLAKAGTSMGLSVVLALYALGFILLSIVYALQIVVASWLAPLLVGIAVGTAAAILYVAGHKKLAQLSLKPEKTLQTFEENVTWLKNQTK